MRVSPIFELSLVFLGAVFTVPQMVEEFNGDAGIGDWETWMKVAPHFFFILAGAMGVIGFMKNILILLNAAWIGSVFALFFTYFLMMFNTRTASQVVCDEWSDVCLDESPGSCDTDLEAYQGLMYILGLCLLIIGGSLTFLFFLEKAIDLRKIGIA
jgi:hypothetical protein